MNTIVKIILATGLGVAAITSAMAYDITVVNHTNNQLNQLWVGSRQVDDCINSQTLRPNGTASYSIGDAGSTCLPESQGGTTTYYYMGAGATTFSGQVNAGDSGTTINVNQKSDGSYYVN